MLVLFNVFLRYVYIYVYSKIYSRPCQIELKSLGKISCKLFISFFSVLKAIYVDYFFFVIYPVDNTIVARFQSVAFLGRELQGTRRTGILAESHQLGFYLLESFPPMSIQIFLSLRQKIDFIHGGLSNILHKE